MRGKAETFAVADLLVGITPAYAGKRPHFWCSKGMRKDHPRLCGEKSIEGQRRVCKEGSPPPMRGKVKKEIKKIQEQRITPAYAGKSHLEPS